MNSGLAEILDLRNLGGDLHKIFKGVRKGSDSCVFTAGRSERVHIAWGLERPLLYVCSDRNAAVDIASRFSEFTGRKTALLVERDDLMLLRQVHQMSGGVERLKALYSFYNQESQIMVTTAEAILQAVPSIEYIQNRVIALECSKDYSIQDLSYRLSSIGYKRVERCEDRGDFSVLGDIITIFPSDKDVPLRLSFFDTELENIKEYDPDTMKSLDELSEITIYPCGELILSQDEKERVLHTLRKEEAKQSAHKRKEEIIQELESRFHSSDIGVSWLIPLLEDNYVTIEQFLPNNCVVVYDDPKVIAEHDKLYYTDFINRYKALYEEGEVTSAHRHAVMKPDKAFSLLDKFTKLGYSALTSANPIFSPKEIFNLKSTPVHAYYMNFNSLFTDVKNFNLRGYRVILCCGDEYTAKNIKNSLYDENIFAVYTQDVDTNTVGVAVTPYEISHGMIYPTEKLVLIGRDELVRKRENKHVARKKRNVFTLPKCGDYVVHEVHGIGLCAGVERIKAAGSEKDYVVIDYAGSDRLYVPVDQMDRLQKYSGSDTLPRLSKIGGKDFAKVKEKVKASVREMAFDLLQLYSQRMQVKGFKYSEDSVWQKEFEDSFEYQETDDQLKAVREIKEDMEKGVVMDRLLCGDVGYGKTEVALRAVFKTVMDGKQACILAPTTILARQHYNTAMARFNEYKLNCVLLSRFQSKEEIEKNKELIRTGKASVIIGTHRLLSEDVVYHDLGLLVLDEEQRFGVEHKDKLKTIKSNVNVLTLSATPIPRTLNMALSGIRDISLLETPPAERIPVQTYVTELTDSLITNAVSKELERDGQVFVLYNRVQGIEKIASKISRLVPQANVIIGHGQMSDSSLEKAINTFYAKEANVMVCTTIIENGIDLPDANTLIVCDADRLGLSALYQLRGRVGRSDKMAYAYFTTEQGKVITEDAMKRLTAIMEYTDFGSGFKIAMRDLEIRGAGNVLGKEQHGHIAKVGYDMYCKLLHEAVEEISGAGGMLETNTEMQIDIDAYMDSDYIGGNDEKIRLYKEIAEISSEEDKTKLIATLSEHYGKPSSSVVNLIDIAMMKNLASKIGALKVVVNNKGAGILFTSAVYKNESVINAVSDMGQDCVLSADTRPMLVFNANSVDINDKVEIVRKFLLKSCKNIN